MKKILVKTVLSLIILINLNLFAKDPGDKISDFTIKDINGNEYSLNKATENGYLVVMFWSTECPYVQPFNDRINDYVNAYKDKGVTFWAINANVTESIERAKEHYQQNKYVFPMMKDDNSKIADLFEATRTPEVYILDKNKTILYHGRIDDNSNIDKVTSRDLLTALDELTSGKEITNKTNKFFGCNIKRASN